MQEINILIVDDHPFIIEGYKHAINSYPQDGSKFVITEAKDCKTGYEAIMNAVDNPFDVALLDFSMPTYEAMNISTGEDLALLLRKEMPRCKIALLTMHTELLKISSIVENLKPNALIIKNDLTFDELLIAFSAVMSDEYYYSPTVKSSVKAVREDYSLDVDAFDKQILFHLSKGTAVIEIPRFVPLMSEAIQQRIENLSALLGSAPNDNPSLVKAAKGRGLV
ncbi:MAG: response regulator [Flavobacterium sp.]